MEAVTTAGIAGRAFVMAFNPAVLEEVRVLAPTQPTALLVDRSHVEESGARSVETVDWAQQARASFLGLHYSLCDASVVAAARAAGIPLGVFTVNDARVMRHLAQLGVDVIITDRADLVIGLEEGPP
jgi:glycerophosphoryl diester phosphodiesterase